MLLSLCTTLLLSIASLTATTHGQVLHANGRWIVNSNNQRVKLRCVNWAGHSEPNIPEGLQWQSVDYITNWIANAGFNCVRLTYSIDMALNPQQRVSDSFTAAGASTGLGSQLTSVYQTAVSKNPFLSTATTRDVYAQVIRSLGNRNIMVVLDNHNSRHGWCCSLSDGNGWWNTASGYDATNSRFFDTNNWLQGLTAMGTFSRQFSNVVGMALRNELRAVGNQDQNSHADWYNFVGQGAAAVHAANPNALVVVGGVSYATDLGFLYNKQLDRSKLDNKVVWEFHTYSWSNSKATSDCPAYKTILGNTAGYLLVQGKPYTGPLWLSEYGWNLQSPTADENRYVDCLVSYMTSNDADWAYWALQGSYYVREGQVNYDETFGLLKKDWSGWRDPNFVQRIGGMWTQTQGP